MGEEEPARPLTLTKDAVIPIGIVVGVLTIFVTATWWIAGLNSKLENIAARLDELRVVVESGAEQSVSVQEIRVWRRLLQQANPTMQVPEWVR